MAILTTTQTYRLHYSVRRYFVDQFYAHHISLLTKGQSILDIGGHKSIKRGSFDIGLYNLKIVYANISIQKGTDIRADALQVPFCDNSFDVIICSELLEHIPYPPRVLQEAWRLLKPQGILLITVPFLYPIHGDPYDFGRYTDHYWSSELEKAKFKLLNIERQGLFYSMLINLCKLYVNHLALSGVTGTPIRYALAAVLGTLQKFAIRHEQKSQVQANAFLQAFTTGFGIKAIKSASQ